MLGSNKKRPAKNVEEFLKSQNMEPPSVTGGAAYDEAGAPGTKRWLVAPVVVAGGLLILLFVAFARIDGLKFDIARLTLQVDKESVEGLKAQVAALGSKVEKSNEEAVQLKANLAQLQNELDAMKLMNERRQKTEAAAKKPAANKKKPVKPTRRGA
jgi:regulator of replication initiation timing